MVDLTLESIKSIITTSNQYNFEPGVYPISCNTHTFVDALIKADIHVWMSLVEIENSIWVDDSVKELWEYILSRNILQPFKVSIISEVGKLLSMVSGITYDKFSEKEVYYIIKSIYLCDIFLDICQKGSINERTGLFSEKITIVQLGEKLSKMINDVNDQDTSEYKRIDIINSLSFLRSKYML